MRVSPRLKPLAEQVMVITGASSGIGLVTAKAAAARGAKVFLVARSGDVLAEAVRGIEATGGVADFAVADVAEASEVEAAAAKAVTRFGRIDSWVNNAGVAIYAALVDTPLDAHERMFRVNYFGMVNGCIAAIPRLERDGGALITVGSVASDMPSPVMGAYSATKHALKAYVETLRMELGQAGKPISVTLIKPSGIDTPIAQHALVPGTGKAEIPPPVYAPELVAEAILAAAERPLRDITVGGAGRAQALFSQHFPWARDLLAPQAAKAFVSEGEQQPQPSNLFGAVRAGHGHSGDSRPRQTSFYMQTQLHPIVTQAIAIPAALLMGGALFGYRAARRLARG